MTANGKCSSCDEITGFYCNIDKKWYCSNHQQFSTTLLKQSSEKESYFHKENNFKPKKRNSPFGKNYFKKH